MHDSGIKVLVQDRLFRPKQRIPSGMNLFRFAPTEPAEFSLSSATCSKEWLLTRLGGQNYLAFWRPGRQTSSIVWGLLMVGKKVLCGNPGLNSTIQAKVPYSFAWALTPTPRNREKRTFCRCYPTLNDFLVELQEDIYGQQGCSRTGSDCPPRFRQRIAWIGRCEAEGAPRRAGHHDCRVLAFPIAGFSMHFSHRNEISSSGMLLS